MNLNGFELVNIGWIVVDGQRAIPAAQLPISFRIGMMFRSFGLPCKTFSIRFFSPIFT